MKYFAALILLVLLGALVWLLFFSGIILKKNSSSENEMVTNSQKPIVVLETNFGKIKLELEKEDAPKTVANFEKLVREKFYDNLTFHRIIPGFVIQGGDPKGDGTGGPGYTIPSEIKLFHKKGAIAMARLPDQVNPQRESSGSQFYVALKDLPELDGQYTVFGNVISGMEIVDKIATVKTGAFDKPLEPVIIKRAYLE